MDIPIFVTVSHAKASNINWEHKLGAIFNRKKISHPHKTLFHDDKQKALTNLVAKIVMMGCHVKF